MSIFYRIKKRGNRGAIVTLLAMTMALVFPIILFIITSLGGIYIQRDRLKFTADSIVSSAVTVIDFDDVYMGFFRFDEDNVFNLVEELMLLHFGATPTTTSVLLGNDAGLFEDNRFEYREIETINSIVRYYIEIFNPTDYWFYADNPDFAMLGEHIPEIIMSDYNRINSIVRAREGNISTVFLAISYEFRSPLMGFLTGTGNAINIVQISTGELRSVDFEVG